MLLGFSIAMAMPIANTYTATIDVRVVATPRRAATGWICGDPATAVVAKVCSSIQISNIRSKAKN